MYLMSCIIQNGLERLACNSRSNTTLTYNITAKMKNEGNDITIINYILEKSSQQPLSNVV